MKSIIYFALLVLLSSCALHSGMIGGSVPAANTACVQTGTAYGSSKTQQILGIGGTRRDALVLDAKQDMYQNYPLSPGQQYGLITLDFKRSFFPFFSSFQVTISADILDCSGDTEAASVTNRPTDVNAFPGSQISPGKTVTTPNGRFEVLSLDMYSFKARRIDQPYFSTLDFPYSALKSPASVNTARLQGSYYILATGDTLSYQSEGSIKQAVVTDPANLYVRPLDAAQDSQFILKPDLIVLPEK
jgi:hypothetical protein